MKASDIYRTLERAIKINESFSEVKLVVAQMILRGISKKY